MSKKEVANTDNGGVPDFIANADTGDDGFDENIDTKTQFTTYSVAQGISDSVTEGWASPGDITINNLEEVLEQPRKLLFFKKDINYRAPEDNRQGTVCFSLTRNQGFVWVSDELDQEAMDEFGVTQEDIDENRRGITHDCNKCSFHPVHGWDDGVPPRCNEEHVYYFLDVTEGFDQEPKRLIIRDTNKPASEAVEAFDNAFVNNLKRNNAPLYGGVFNITTKGVEYSNGNKGFGWDIEFDSFVQNKELFEWASQCRDEFESRRKDMIEEAKNQAVQDVTEEEEAVHDKEEGPAFRDNDGEDEAPAWPKE